MGTFEILNSVNVNEFTEKKNNLTYLSWANAWGETVKRFPDATYTIERFDDNLPYVKDDTGYMVFTTVTIEGITREMWLPVMDYRNQAIKADKCSMTDVNKAIMRCLTKNLAMFGMGLYIYKGEDLPDEEDDKKEDLKKIESMKIANVKVAALKAILAKNQIQESYLCKLYNVKKLDDLTEKKFSNIINNIKGIKEKQDSEVSN